MGAGELHIKPSLVGGHAVVACLLRKSKTPKHAILALEVEAREWLRRQLCGVLTLNLATRLIDIRSSDATRRRRGHIQRFRIGLVTLADTDFFVLCN